MLSPSERMLRIFLSIVVVVAVAIAPACDSVTPVAPEGSVLTIGVNPTFIEPTGSAKVTVIARQPDGQPVHPGTEVFFTTTLGTIDRMATTDGSGVAEATLRGDGRAGTAMVTATSGAAAAAVSDPVQIGAFAALISLQVTPTVVTEEGGTLDLLSIVRDDNGALLADAVVNFVTEFGVLASGGAGIVTNASGEARDSLTVSGADIAAAGSGFIVTAQTAGTGGTLIEQTFSVTVARLEPIAAFSFSTSGLTVQFSNQSTGAQPLKYAWDFDGDGTIDSTARSPSFTYVAGGTYTVRLDVSNQFGSDTAIETVTVVQ